MPTEYEKQKKMESRKKARARAFGAFFQIKCLARLNRERKKSKPSK